MSPAGLARIWQTFGALLALYAIGVDLHFMVRLGRSKKGLGISREIGVAFQSRMKCSSECCLFLNRGLPSLNVRVGYALATGPHRFDCKFV
jgi:hypothetical protein